MKDSRIWSSMLTGTRWGFCSIDGWKGQLHRRRGSDVEVAHVERVFLDELPPWLHLVAHEGGEDLVGLVRVLDLHLQQRARLGVHRRLPELRRVHLAETLVALDLETLARRGHDAIDGATDAEDGLGLVRLAALARAMRRPAGGRELARDAPRLLEFRGQEELAVEHVAMRGAVGARKRDEPQARVLAILLEREAHRHEVGRSGREVSLG